MKQPISKETAVNNELLYRRHITSSRPFFQLNFKRVFAYKDLIFFYARKNVVTSYRQTVFGPLWLFLVPLFNSLLQMFVFGYLAGFKTGGVPKIIFYLFSNTAWQFYSQCVNSNQQIFTQNSRLFEKVFFPRLTISYANMASTAFTLAIQLVLAMVFYLVFLIRGELPFSPLFPLAVVPLLMMMLMGQGMGLIYACLIVRYRDFRQLFPMITHVLMYVSPVVYPLAQLGEGTLRQLFLFVPFCAPLELLRFFLWKAPLPPLWSILYSAVFAVVINLFGILLFNYTEKDFIDSI